MSLVVLSTIFIFMRHWWLHDLCALIYFQTWFYVLVHRAIMQPISINVSPRTHYTECLVLSLSCWVSGREATGVNLSVFYFTRPGSNHLSSGLEANAHSWAIDNIQISPNYDMTVWPRFVLASNTKLNFYETNISFIMKKLFNDC